MMTIQVFGSTYCSKILNCLHCGVWTEYLVLSKLYISIEPGTGDHTGREVPQDCSEAARIVGGTKGDILNI